MEDLEFRVKRLEEDCERNQQTHKEFYAKFESIGKESAGMSTNLANISALCAEIKADVKSLADKPGKRWESIVGSVLQWAVLGVLAYAISSSVR